MEHRCLSPWKGAVVGGLIAFAWHSLSRMALPFHVAALLGLLAQMTGAFFWTWILGKIPGLTLKDAALYGLFFGVCVGVLGGTPTLARVADAAIAWTLASTALSRCYAAACPLPA
jgi:hypothetical protein